MGVSDTMGFILYHVIYGSVQILPVQVMVYMGMDAVWEIQPTGYRFKP